MPDLAHYSPNHNKDKSKRHTSLPRSVYPVDAAIAFAKKAAPNAEFRMAEDHYTSSSGITHVNFKLTLDGIDVDNGDLKVVIGRDGGVFSFSNNCYVGQVPRKAAFGESGLVAPTAALQAAAKLLGLSIGVSESTIEADTTKNNTFIAKSVSGFDRDPIMKLAT